MTPERWRQVEALYQAVQHVSPPAGRALLEQADPELRREVQSLLAQEVSVLDRPALDALTESMPLEAIPGTQLGHHSNSIDEGRFPAGTLLAKRYRVIRLLGRGGMGEVYHANDLKLDQPVALKFLPQSTGRNAPLLARFHAEVRIARQVSHSNMCRVYDIGEVDGSAFLSMEYVDGEDLRSLLRRIGRLPADKAIEFARRICAGLSAAHERGVLHRDLKPANIMIDGRGQVLIMDFGLASLEAEVALGDIRSGTPAYMSPEQKSGKAITKRSDLYSLGLVLYEMFTGKRRGDSQSSPSDLVKDLDPAIERVILRCLEEDPQRRPSSALKVALSLPGGDPITAALAAGETPSPEMVAASQEKEGFRPRVAVTCFVGVILMVLVSALLGARTSLLGHALLEIPPEGLVLRAQDMLTQFGYVGKPQKIAYGFDYWDTSALRYLQLRDAAHLDDALATHRPAVIGFWYRQHQDEFWADSFQITERLNDVITYSSPANDQPGMIRLILDPTGRLLLLEAQPSLYHREASERTPNWAALFSVAGLDPARFTAAEPERTPPGAFDARAAWIGTFAEERPEQIRVEAASWQKRPVYFRVTGDWQPRETPPTPVTATALRLLLAGLLIVIVAGGALTARHNLRTGRGDRRGASIIATVGFLCVMCGWMFTAAHVPSYWEMHLLIKALMWAGFVAGLFSSLYLATEPFVRRHWPDALISWSRLTANRFRDPLVASHVLAGIVAAEGLVTWLRALQIVARPVLGLTPGPLLALNGVPSFLGFLSTQMGLFLFLVMVFQFLLALLRPLGRHMWIAEVLGSILLALGSGSVPVLVVAGEAVGIYAAWSVLRRMGLLAWLSAGVTFGIVTTLVASVSSWYGGRSLVLLLVPAGMAGWAMWVIISARESSGH